MQQTWSRAEKTIVAAAVAIGVAERVGWDMARKVSGATGEAANVAVALATRGQFADAFQPGQGPTAHLMPTTPAIAGAVYALFGVRTAASEIILGGWALLLTFGVYALFCAVAARIGVPRRARIAAFAVLAVAPVYTSIEAVDFRVWEGGLAMALAGTLLLGVLRFERRDIGWRGIGGLALLAAALFFVSPPLGLGGYLVLAIFALRRLDGRQVAGAAVLAALALALFVAPWALRNQRAMGEPILLRDNLGLELALANHPGAVDPRDSKAAFDARLMAIHPFPSLDAFRRMEAVGGEAAYARLLGAEAKAWMAAHPADVVRLFAKHLREFVLPRAWEFQTAHGVWLPRIRSALASAVSLLGLIGLARRRSAAAGYLAALLLVPPLAYLPFQPITRYAWLLYPPLAYLAADLIAGFFDSKARAGVSAPPRSATSVASDR